MRRAENGDWHHSEMEPVPATIYISTAILPSWRRCCGCVRGVGKQMGPVTLSKSPVPFVFLTYRLWV
jgi:hypothetical protein